MTRRKWLSLAALAAVVLLLAFGGEVLAPSRQRASADGADFRTALVVRGSFRKTVRRAGTIQAVNEHHIIGRIRGQIVEIAPQGRAVAKGEVILRQDATPYEDKKQNQEAYIASLQAKFKKQKAETQKGLNAAREDVASLELRATLEKMRLDDLNKGPDDTAAINARVNLENARALLAATKEDLAALESLAPAGFVSKEEVRQKQLDAKEQELKVRDADINQQKLYVPDKVKIAEQELKVRDAGKTRDAAKDRLALYERNFERDENNRARTLAREKNRLKEIVEDIEKTIYRAPAAGTVIHKRARWYDYAPGRDVRDGWEVLGLPDYSRMKVVLAVDEARIGSVTLGQSAAVVPAGWHGKPFSGKITHIGEKGHDEFEPYADDTTQITGTANRQVFDVEVEIEGQSPLFMPGLGASVEILLDSREDVLLVPRAAVFHDSEGEPIARVASDGGVEIRRISLVAYNDFTAVVEGLKEGERVFIVPENESKP